MDLYYDLRHPVAITVPDGGTRVEVTIPFYDAVGTHTARRSFATNMYKHYRLPTLTIMKITGHTTETNFFKYIKMTREENAQLILDPVTAKIELEKAGSTKLKDFETKNEDKVLNYLKNVCPDMDFPKGKFVNDIMRRTNRNEQ